MNQLNEELLDEANRQQLIAKSVNADSYKDTSHGKNRYERRRYSKVANTVAQYNSIDMDAFFKHDILTIGIQVHGETDTYTVKMKFSGVLDEIAQEVKANKGKFEFKVVARSLVRVFNNGSVFVHCDCPDARYRQSYWQTKNGYNAGPDENRPSDRTNPADTKGAGCKHVLLVLSNLDWMMKVASTINNYVHYCQDYMQSNYSDYIFPALYGTPYKKAVQLNMFGDGLLAKDRKELDTANAYGASRGRFQKGNKFAFRPGMVWTSYDKNGNALPKKNTGGQMTIGDSDSGQVPPFRKSDVR